MLRCPACFKVSFMALAILVPPESVIAIIVEPEPLKKAPKAPACSAAWIVS